MDSDRFKIRRDRITRFGIENSSPMLKFHPPLFRRDILVDAYTTNECNADKRDGDRVVSSSESNDRPLAKWQARRGIGPSKVFGTNDRSQSAARREACCTFRAFQASLRYRPCALVATRPFSGSLPKVNADAL